MLRNLYLFFLHLYCKFFSKNEVLQLYHGRSKYQSYKVEFNCRDNSLTMSSHKGFMGGMHISSGLPISSPFYLSDFYINNPNKVLFLGGGPCCDAISLHNRNSKVDITIVERDTLTIKLAKKYFDLPNSKNITISINDVDKFIKESSSKSDIIFFDLGFAYSRRKLDSYKFCQKDSTFEKLREILTPNGVLVFVVISSRSGLQKEFLNKLKTKFEKVFPFVDLYCDKPNEDAVTQSHIFISGNKSVSKKSKGALLGLKGYWGDYYRELSLKKINIKQLGKLTI